MSHLIAKVVKSNLSHTDTDGCTVSWGNLRAIKYLRLDINLDTVQHVPLEQTSDLQAFIWHSKGN